MTVRQLLESLDSRELSEWYVVEDLEFWKKRLAEKEAKEQSSEYVLNALFGKQIESGDVVWRDQKQQ